MLSPLCIWNDWMQRYGQKTSKMPKKWGVSPICDPQDFVPKSGSVTFVPLWCPNFMQKTKKTNEPSLRYLKTDWRTDGHTDGRTTEVITKDPWGPKTKKSSLHWHAQKRQDSFTNSPFLLMIIMTTSPHTLKKANTYLQKQLLNLIMYETGIRLQMNQLHNKGQLWGLR